MTTVRNQQYNKLRNTIIEVTEAFSTINQDLGWSFKETNRWSLMQPLTRKRKNPSPIKD